MLENKTSLGFWATCVFLLLSNTTCAHALLSSRKVHSGELSKHQLINTLAPALKNAGVGARIYFQAYCRPRDQQIRVNAQSRLQFPSIRIMPSNINGLDVNRIRSIFRADPTVSVYVNRGNLLSVDIGHVDTAILNTNIALIHFSPEEQYTPDLAIDAILGTKYIRSAERVSNMRLVDSYSIVSVQMPFAGLPHLPSTIRNMTLDEALNLIASTFHGLVMYGACEKMHLYEVSFQGGFDYDGAGHP